MRAGASSKALAVYRSLKVKQLDVAAFSMLIKARVEVVLLMRLGPGGPAAAEHRPGGRMKLKSSAWRGGGGLEAAARCGRHRLDASHGGLPARERLRAGQEDLHGCLGIRRAGPCLLPQGA